jgi:hypothetical protein
MIIIVPRTRRTETAWRYIGSQESELLSSSTNGPSVGPVLANCSTLPRYDITDPTKIFAKGRYYVLACLVGFWSPTILEEMRGSGPGFEPLLDMIDELRNAGMLSKGRLVPRQIPGEYVSLVPWWRRSTYSLSRPITAPNISGILTMRTTFLDRGGICRLVDDFTETGLQGSLDSVIVLMHDTIERTEVID